MTDAAYLQCFNVVGNRLLVDGGREAVITFIAGHKRLQGAAINEVLDGVKLRIVTLVFSDVGHVHVVESGEVIKMEYMILGDVSAVDKVTDNTTVIGYLISYTEGTIEVQRGGDAMRLRADATDTLGYYLGVTRVASPQDKLKSAKEAAGGPGVFNDAILDDALYFQMAFDPGNGVDNNPAHYFTSLALFAQ
jgi:hypothetical protein